MATNTNGNLVDDAGNVVVDFVWGNFPMQPNDVRHENGGTHLDFTLDSHNIVEDGWNGYPLYTPNTAGGQSAGVDYIVVPNVLGSVATDAATLLGDLELNTTVASAATNTATQPTRINVTATTAATVYVSGGTGTWAVGNKVTIATGTGIPAALVGTWSVTGGSSSTLVISGSGWTVADTGSITPGTKLTGASGTVKAQSIAAGQKRAAGTAMTVTPWA